MISASSKKETTNTGVYTIDPDGSVASNVFFDQTTAGPVRWRGGGEVDGLSEETGWLG